jgi:hypothetical protein
MAGSPYGRHPVSTLMRNVRPGPGASRPCRRAVTTDRLAVPVAADVRPMAVPAGRPPGHPSKPDGHAG